MIFSKAAFYRSDPHIVNLFDTLITSLSGVKICTNLTFVVSAAFLSPLLHLASLKHFLKFFLVRSIYMGQPFHEICTKLFTSRLHG